jgi:hypothetical protein
MLKCNRITRVTVLLLATIVWPHALKAAAANDSKTTPVTASKRVFDGGNFQHLFWQQSAMSGSYCCASELVESSPLDANSL